MSDIAICVSCYCCRADRCMRRKVKEITTGQVWFVPVRSGSDCPHFIEETAKVSPECADKEKEEGQ